MCQIITIETKDYQVKDILDPEQEIIHHIIKKLAQKGGDYFSAGITIPELNIKKLIPFDPEDINSLKEMHAEVINYLPEIAMNNTIVLMFFSRQQPEMETAQAKEQPYLLKNADYSEMIAIHGTIYNDKELAKKYDFKIGVDTEVFLYLNFGNPEIEGTFAAIQVDESGKINTWEHGLKIWEDQIVFGSRYYGKWIATTPFKEKLYQANKKENLISCFSTGMDIALSTYKAIANGNYKRIYLVYFAWGSRAEEAEMKKLDEFKDFYSRQFQLPVSIYILDANYFFKNYFKITGAKLPKIAQKEAQGVQTETESPIAYVPYRNTMFVTTLAAWAEAHDMTSVDIVFGLNLSEGMVFMDNSEGWLETVNSSVKYGGKDPKVTYTYDVIAPYFSRTKTNMLKEFKEEFGMTILEQLLEMSHSCYYPSENGEPCGECGSCLLRKKAIERILDAN